MLIKIETNLTSKWVGFRITVFIAIDALLSQQVGNQTTNLNYDLDGNLKNDSKFHYAFDAFQRIVEVKDQSQNLVAKYQMDTSNRRISKAVGTTAHRTVYAGWQVAEEHETAPSGKKFKTTTKVYVYGQYIDEPLVMKITKPNGNQKKCGVEEDHPVTSVPPLPRWELLNTYALTNDNGKIVETYHYSAYGKLEIKDADGSTLTESAYANTCFYTARLLDQETGLFYFRNRYYSANQGRFISRDPIGYVDGMSLYRGYFAVNGLDWSGLKDYVLPGVNPVVPSIQGTDYLYNSGDQSVANNWFDNPSNFGSSVSSLTLVATLGFHSQIESIIAGRKISADMNSSNECEFRFIAHSQGSRNATHTLRRFAQKYCEDQKDQCDKPCEKVRIRMVLIAPKTSESSVRNAVAYAQQQCPKLDVQVMVIYDSGDSVIPIGGTLSPWPGNYGGRRGPKDDNNDTNGDGIDDIIEIDVTNTDQPLGWLDAHAANIANHASSQIGSFFHN